MLGSKINIVVIGAPRSGTTLLAGILANAERTAPMLPECTFATQLISHYYNIVKYSDRQRFSAWAINESVLQNIYQTAVSSFISNASSNFDVTSFDFIISKDPELTIYTDLIRLFFGDNCKCVCVVRDPSAVISSMRRVINRKRNESYLSFRNDPTWDRAKTILDLWFEGRNLIPLIYNYYYISHTSALAKENRVHFVKYENIASRDESEFQRLEAFVGYEIKRDGFGTPAFSFDERDPYHSDNYGGEIIRVDPNLDKAPSNEGFKKIQGVFSGFNEIYRWW
jgi:hypothetical protein